MRGSTIGVAALCLALVSASARPAAAERPSCYDCCDGCSDGSSSSDKPPKWETEVGPWISFLILQGYSGIMIGGRMAVGRRDGRLLYLGEAELAHASLGMKDGKALVSHIRGYGARAGANLRWTFASVGGNDVSIDFWLQGGVGAKLIQWWDGGRIVRPDGQIGIGLSEVFGRKHRFSLDAGAMFIVGRGHSRGTPTCAGPCDEPTPPVSTDFEIIDHIAFAGWF